MSKYNCYRCLLVNLKTPADPVVFATEGDNGISHIDFQGNLCKRCVDWIYKNPDENISKLNSCLASDNRFSRKTEKKQIEISLKEELHMELIDWHIENACLDRGFYGDANGEWNK